MKWISRTLIILLLLSTLMILGALFGGMNFSVVSNFFKDDEAYGDIKEFEASELIIELSINFDDRNIVIEYIESGSLSLTYYEHEKDQWSINEEDGKLTITQKRTFSLLNNFTFKYTSREVKTVTIFVPLNTLLVLDAHTDVGDVSINLSDSELTTVELSTDTGNISVKDLIITQNLIANSDTGNISLEFVEAQTMVISCDTGRVKIDDSKAETITVSNSTGDVVIKRTEANNLLKVTTQTGRVDVRNTSSINYQLKTSTGNIYFEYTELASETISYDLKVSVGTIYLNSQSQGNRHQTTSGDISIKAESSTGNIRIITQ